MALAVDTTSKSNGVVNLTTKTVTFSHTCSGANRVLVVAIGSYNATPTGVNYAGTSMSLAVGKATGKYRTFIYYLIEPDTGANNIVITFDKGNLAYSAGGISFTGANQATQPESVASEKGTSRIGYSQNITTGVNGCYLVDMCCKETIGSSDFAPKTGQTLISINNEPSEIAGSSYKSVAVAGVHAMGWDWDSSVFDNDWASSIVSIQPLAAPPVGTNMKVNIGDSFKDVDSLKINIGGVWKDVVSIKQNIGDVWKDVFS